MKRLFASFATLVIFGTPQAWAAPVVVLSSDDNEVLNIEIDADRGRASVFQKASDLWVVFSGRDNPQVRLPKEMRTAFNIDAQEVLNSAKGSGVRIAFDDKAPKFNISYSRILNGAKEDDVTITVDDNGLMFENFEEARFVNVHSSALNKNYMVLPMSAANATAAKNNGDLNQEKAFSGLVFSGKTDTPLRTVFVDGKYYLATDMDKLVALSNKYATKPNNPQESELLTKPAIAALQPVVEEAVKVSTVPNNSRLSTEKSKIILMNKAEKTAPTAGSQANIAEDDSKKIEAFSDIRPIGGVFSSVTTEENKTADSQPNTNVNAKKTAQPSLLTEILNKGSVKVGSNASPSPMAAKSLDTAWGKDVRIVPDVDYSNGAPEHDIILNEDLTEAMGVINEALSSLKSIYEPSKNIAKVGNEISEDLTDNGTPETPDSDFFGEDVADAEDYDESEYINTDTIDGLLDNDDAFAEVDETEDLIITLEQGPLFFQIPQDPDVSRAKIGELHEDTYLYKHNKIMERLGQSFSRVKRDRVRLQLAKLALAYNRSNETLSYVDYMPKLPSNPILPEAEDARILAGVANIMLHRPAEGLVYIEEPTANYEKDRKLWQAVAYEALENDALSLKLFTDNISQAKSYPYPLLKEVYFSYGRVLLRLERITELTDLMRDLARQSPKAKLPPEGLLLMARANVLENNDNATENLLAQAAAGDNKEVSFLAQYEFVRFLFSKGDITIKQAIEHMERLRFLWRGGDLEEDILYKLGRMYLARGEQRIGLERLKQHNVHYPNSKNIEETTLLMMSAFKELFLEEATLDSKLDDLGLLGVYYDYRELTPPGKVGDTLITNIAQRLRNLGLFERSSKILEQQLEYRAKDPVERAEIGLRLADLYRLDEEFDEALNALIRTETSDIDDALQLSREIKQAEILFDDKAYDDATKILKDMDDPRAADLRADIAWQQGTYKDIITELEPVFDKTENLPKTWGVNENVNFIRLAVAYNILDRTRDLEDLKRRYKIELKANKQLSEVTDFLLREQGSNQVVLGGDVEGVWPKLVEAFDIYHSFSESYDALREEREAEKIERKIFNRRMRQMTAPPRL